MPYIQPSEFWELEDYELTVLLEGIERYFEPVLQVCRFNGYVTAQSNSKKRLTPESLYVFPWERKKEEDTKQATEALSREEVKARAERFKRLLLESAEGGGSYKEY